MLDAAGGPPPQSVYHGHRSRHPRVAHKYQHAGGSKSQYVSENVGILLFAGPSDDPLRFVRILRVSTGDERALTIPRGQIFAEEADDLSWAAKRTFREKCMCDGWSEEPDEDLFNQLQVAFQTVKGEGSPEGTDCVRVGYSARWVGGWANQLPTELRDVKKNPEWTQHWVLRVVHLYTATLILPLDTEPQAVLPDIGLSSWAKTADVETMLWDWPENEVLFNEAIEAWGSQFPFGLTPLPAGVGDPYLRLCAQRTARLAD